MQKKDYILADNQDITRIGLHSVIQELNLCKRIIPVCSKRELTPLLKENQDAIIVLDYTLFDFSRPEELFNIQERFPHTRWILFSEELTPGFIDRVCQNRAFSILLKNASKQEICEALTDTISGNLYPCTLPENQIQTVKEKVISDRPILTATEKEILKLIAQGKSVKEIAAIRISSAHTIITHKKNIFRKLGVNNVYEAIRYAFRAGIIDIAEYCI